MSSLRLHNFEKLLPVKSRIPDGGQIKHIEIAIPPPRIVQFS